MRKRECLFRGGEERRKGGYLYIYIVEKGGGAFRFHERSGVGMVMIGLTKPGAILPKYWSLDIERQREGGGRSKRYNKRGKQNCQREIKRGMEEGTENERTNERNEVTSGDRVQADLFLL